MDGFNKSCADSTTAQIQDEQDRMYDYMEFSDTWYCPQCGADTSNPCGCVDEDSITLEII
jgi:hypothetical protein